MAVQWCKTCSRTHTVQQDGVCLDCKEKNRMSYLARLTDDEGGSPMDAAVAKFKAVKDSGVRESFLTGAVRDTEEGKPRIDLLLKYVPMTALMRITQHYVNGAKKYGDHNWQKGIPASRCISSAFRHLYQYLIGDRGEDHLSAVCFNVIAILHWEETKRSDMLDIHQKSLEKGGVINGSI